MGGHSLWFRLFFATFLPVKTDHPCTKKKMVNGILGPPPASKPPSRHLTTANHCFAPPPPPARSAHRWRTLGHALSRECAIDRRNATRSKERQRRTVVWMALGRRQAELWHSSSARPTSTARGTPPQNPSHFLPAGQRLRRLAAFPPRAAVGASTHACHDQRRPQG